MRLSVAVLLAYLAVLLALTFLPLNGIIAAAPLDIHLVPFKSIGLALRRGPGTHEFVLLVGNVVAFMPVGILLPIILRRRSLLIVLGAALALSLGIELGQLAVSVLIDSGYRTTDIDDVIVNVFGAALGYAVLVLGAFVAERADRASG